MNKLVICPQCQNHIEVSMPRFTRIKRDIYARRSRGGAFELILESTPGEIVGEYTATIQAQQSGLFGIMAGLTIGAGAAFAGVEPAFAASGGGMAFLGGTTFAYGFLIHGHALRVRVAAWLRDQRGAVAQGRTAAQSVASERTNVTRVEIDERGPSNYSKYLGELPCDRDRLAAWSRAAVAGDSIAIGKWTGAARPFARKEYEVLIKYMREYPPRSPILELAGGGNRVTRHGKNLLGLMLREWANTPPAA